MRQNNITAIFSYLLDYTPTSDQNVAMKLLSEYVAENKNDSIFLLTGYAGTGKTTLISALVKTLERFRIKTVLLAPTGRAAKVFSLYSGKKSFTIHKKIYRQKSAKDGLGTFTLDRNLHKETYFIVDEASMIGNGSGDSSSFGSGKLLDDLIEYVYSGSGCKLILSGDPAQLPPVGSPVSPALDIQWLQGYGFGLESCELREVVRQSEESGILVNATAIRRVIGDDVALMPELCSERFPDVERIGGESLIDSLQDAYNRAGVEETVVVVNSNYMANKYNKGIRAAVFFREEEVSAGDLLMVVKNNYFWLGDEAGEETGFLANGDIAEVRRIKKYEERYGFRFAEMTLWFIDYQTEVDARVILDTLHYDTPSMPADKNKELYDAVLNDYQHIKQKRKQWMAIREDSWFNALQVKFAYAVTCHKAQGGQWKRVFVDQGMFNKKEPDREYLRWLYTAVTRATEKLSLVNFSDKYFPGE